MDIVHLVPLFVCVTPLILYLRTDWLDSYEISVYRWCLDNYNKVFGDLE